MKIKIIALLSLTILSGCAPIFTNVSEKKSQADVAYLNGSYDEAIKKYSNIIDRNGDNVGDVYFKLYELKKNGHQVKYSFSYLLNKSLERQYYKAYIEKAKKLYLSGDKQNATKNFLKAIKYSNGNTEPFLEYGKFLLTQGERNKGIDMIKKSGLLGNKEASCKIYNMMKNGETTKDGDYFYFKERCIH